MSLNADGAAGAVRVEIVDRATAKAYPGFERDRCLPITDDAVNAPVCWQEADLAALAGRPVMLRFILEPGARECPLVAPCLIVSRGKTNVRFPDLVRGKAIVFRKHEKPKKYATQYPQLGLSWTAVTMTQNKVRWEEMLPHEFLEARDWFPVCYAAYGLAEPHGAYNALGLDWLKAYALVESAAKRYGGIVAPPFAWHIQEVPEFHDDGKGHGWLCEVGVRQSLCSSIPSDLFYRTVFYHIRAMDARGFHAAVLVTGHYGGVEKVLRKICEYYLRCTGSPIRLYAIADWECIDEDLPYRGDHAGVCETSQLMALKPGLTDLKHRTGNEELGERYAAGVHFSKGPLPTPEIGKKIVESQVRNLCGTAKRLLAEYRLRDRWIAPNLNETEKIWDNFERITRKYWTPIYSEYKKGKLFQFPKWEALEK